MRAYEYAASQKGKICTKLYKHEGRVQSVGKKAVAIGEAIDCTAAMAT